MDRRSRLNEIEEDQHLFVVRFWLETRRGKPASWRGMVEHIHHGRKIYFASLQNLTDFIALRLDNLPGVSPGKEPLDEKYDPGN
jgi:hypothetical protein